MIGFRPESSSVSNVVRERHHQNYLASWHPIQTSPSEDMWELPSRNSYDSEDVDVDEPEGPRLRAMSSTEQHGTLASMSWNLENFSGLSNTSDSQRSPMAPRSSTGGANISINSSSNSSRGNNAGSRTNDTQRRNNRRMTLGDATNTAPVLNVRRSQFA